MTGRLRAMLGRLAWWRPRAHVSAGYGWPDDPADYEGRMLERLNAGLPVGTPADWDRPDPPWLADPGWTG